MLNTAKFGQELTIFDTSRFSRFLDVHFATHM